MLNSCIAELCINCHQLDPLRLLWKYYEASQPPACPAACCCSVAGAEVFICLWCKISPACISNLLKLAIAALQHMNHSFHIGIVIQELAKGAFFPIIQAVNEDIK